MPCAVLFWNCAVSFWSRPDSAPSCPSRFLIPCWACGEFALLFSSFWSSPFDLSRLLVSWFSCFE